MRFRTTSARKVTAAVLGALAAVLLVVTSPAVASPGDDDATYEVTFTNLTGGQYFTPPNWAIHGTDASVYSLSSPASPGVQAVAENGGVPTLAAELAATIDGAGNGSSGVGAAEGPVGPGQSITFTIAGDRDRLSIVSMLVCTNDGFAGLDTKALPSNVGQTKRHNLLAHDAGTELNTEVRGDLVPAEPCGPGAGSGMSNPDLAEGGVVPPPPRHRRRRRPRSRRLRLAGSGRPRHRHPDLLSAAVRRRSVAVTTGSDRPPTPP